MKVAIPVWDSRISPVFDSATQVLIVSVEGGKEISRAIAPLSDEVFLRRVDLLLRKGVEVLICGAISRPLANLVASSGIELIPRMAGNAEEVLGAFLKGGLPDPRFLMPGCCGGPRRFRRGQERFHRGRGCNPWHS